MAKFEMAARETITVEEANKRTVKVLTDLAQVLHDRYCLEENFQRSIAYKIARNHVDEEIRRLDPVVWADEDTQTLRDAIAVQLN